MRVGGAAFTARIRMESYSRRRERFATTSVDGPDIRQLPGRVAGCHIGMIALITLLSAAPDASADSQTGKDAMSPTSPTVVARGVAHANAETPLLPRNLLLPEIVRPLAEAMWRRSPTFRRQCARLSENAVVIVNIELDSRARHGRHALTRISRHDPGLTAMVKIELRRPELYVEYLAHELEHVLEHIDGVDLPRLARRGLNGVVNSGGQYETARARAVGQAVVREMAVH